MATHGCGASSETDIICKTRLKTVKTRQLVSTSEFNMKYTTENSILLSNYNPYTRMMFYKDYITSCTTARVVPYDF